MENYLLMNLRDILFLIISIIKMIMINFTNSIMLSFSPEVNAAIIACIGSFIAAFISIYQTVISKRDNKKNITRVDLLQKKKY